MRVLRWRPGDPLPTWWDWKTACPAGHPWGPGRINISYVFGVYHVSCAPPSPWACPWIFVRDADSTEDGAWTRRGMSARWDKDAGGRLLPGGGREIELLQDDGTWLPALLDGWQPIVDAGWLAEVRDVDHTGARTVPAQQVRRPAPSMS